MKKMMVVIALLGMVGIGFASDWTENSGRRPYKDVYGHSYKNAETLDKDSDGDGVSNRYDYNDRDGNVQYKHQRNDFGNKRRSRRDY